MDTLRQQLFEKYDSSIFPVNILNSLIISRKKDEILKTFGIFADGFPFSFYAFFKLYELISNRNIDQFNMEKLYMAKKICEEYVVDEYIKTCLAYKYTNDNAQSVDFCIIRHGHGNYYVVKGLFRGIKLLEIMETPVLIVAMTVKKIKDSIISDYF